MRRKEGMNVSHTNHTHLAGSASGGRGEVRRHSAAVDKTGLRVRATVEKRARGSSSLAAPLETQTSPLWGLAKEPANKRALDAVDDPPGLPGAEDVSGTPASGSSSPNLAAGAVKAEEVPAPAVEVQGVVRGRSAPHGIPLSLVGARSCFQGGRDGSPPLMRSDLM